MTDRPYLDALIEKSKAMVAAMSPEEREAMYAAQRESWVRAEAAWPKPRYKIINGCRVYESYEDCA